MYRKYVYKRSDDISTGDEIDVPEGVIGIRIVDGYFLDGVSNTKRYIEWLEPVKD